MRRLMCGAALFLAAAGDLSGTPQQAPPVFRADADLVSVDVSVRSGDRAVQGLTSEDFVLLDNGVRQSIRVSGADGVPLDLTLILDLSYSRAQFGTPERVRADVTAIAQLLRPTDRVRVAALSTGIVEVAPLQSPGDLRLGVLPIGGWSPIRDAIAAALLRLPSPDRRHLVVAFTDGFDTFSLLQAEALQAIAQRTDAVLQVVIADSPPGAMFDTIDVARRQQYPPRPYPLPLIGEPSRTSPQVLADAAEATGGRRHDPSLFGQSMVSAFRSVFDHYRSSYVLQYELTGAPRAGWHEIKVGVTRPGRFNVQARRGYFID